MTTPLHPEVPFIAQAPLIDGRLDPELQDLPAYSFSNLMKTSPENPAADVSYRMAYGADFLYLYLEWPGERIACRDRGYQNGDGFILILANPRADDQPTEEFYVLGFSAQEHPATNWAKKIQWYYNVETTLSMLSPAVQLAWQVQDGRAAFELLLPWSEVYPYHPWLSAAIGFNLAFVEAVGEKETNYHFLIDDPELGGEGAPRMYHRLRFAAPHLAQGAQVAMRMDRHCRTGETVAARFALLSATPADQTIRLAIGPGEGGQLSVERTTLPGSVGLTLHEHPLATASLPPGGYRIRWRDYNLGLEDEIGLTVLPSQNLEQLAERLQEVKPHISNGSYTTTQFQLDEIGRQLAQVKPYETCGQVSYTLKQWMTLVEAAAAGQDPLAIRTGIFRRAFRSAIDDTLQPYSVCVPADYDPAKKYPLLVMLHGSGMTDRGFLEGTRVMIPDEFIAIAPSGRGISHCYCPPEAQMDIQEAIEDVTRCYAIDTERVVLGGFSMGGYGVYRTHYETPGKYYALVAMSGRVRLDPDWGIADAPDFLQEEALQTLVGVPLFIFHGQQDRNVPVDDVLTLVEKLRAAGSPVEVHLEAGAGHAIPAEEIIQAYRRWLKDVLDRRHG
jgi:predicted esterase